MRKRCATRWLASVLSAVLFLTGCSGSLESRLQEMVEQAAPTIEAGKTISEDSKWVNSDVDGAITKDTPTNLKDDFHTAVNKDWILEQEVTDDGGVSGFDSAGELLEERMLQLLRMDPENTDGLDPAVMEGETLVHIQNQVLHFSALAGDWKTRNAAGSEPLRPYIEAIEKIQTLSELTEYLKDTEGQKLSTAFFVPFSIGTPAGTDTENYTVYLTADPPLALGAAEEYMALSADGIGSKELTDMAVQDVLGSLGYEKAEIRRILRECYLFEAALSEALPASTEMTEEDYLKENHHECGQEALRELAGNYPLLEILDSYGFGASAHFTVHQPEQLSQAGRLYTEDRLSQMKSYYIVHTVLEGLPLLDAERVQEAESLSAAKKKNEEEGEEEDELQIADEKLQDTLNNYIWPYLGDAFQQMYIGHYCSAETKQEILDMTKEIIGTFREMLSGETWLQEETKEKACEKLDFMGIHVLYPDQLRDYSALDISAAESLPAAVADINRFRLMKGSELVNQPVNRSNWDLEMLPTVNVNAAYMMTDNSINIEAGILLAEDFFRTGGNEAENMGRLGFVVGHEITHGFDTSGYKYDKNGLLESWWLPEDQEQFDIRAARVMKYYNGLTPLPQTSCSGKAVSGEAIADMGSMRCMLKLAESRTDFDYDLFFRTFAAVWRCRNSYYQELRYLSNEHPLGFLRTNVTLSQFEEFYRCYGIQAGDGMYVNEADRIAVW